MPVMLLPGISAIFSLNSQNLPAFCVIAAMAGGRVPVFSELTEIPLAPGATVKAEEESAPEGASRKTTLQFTAEKINFTVHDRMAFVVFTADGDQFLIGTKEPPFPKIKIADNRSTPSKGEAGISVSVEWNGALMPCHSFYSSFGVPMD